MKLDHALEVEQGPLRRILPKFHVWPSWAYLDHGPIPYVTLSDHRSETGRIIPLGTSCVVERKGGQLIHTLEGDRIVLDGGAWAIEGAPIVSVELLLSA